MSSSERKFLKTLKGAVVSYRNDPKTQNLKSAFLNFPVSKRPVRRVS